MFRLCGMWEKFSHESALRKHTKIHNHEKGKEYTEILSQHDVKPVIVNAETLSNVSLEEDIQAKLVKVESRNMVPNPVQTITGENKDVNIVKVDIVKEQTEMEKLTIIQVKEETNDETVVNKVECIKVEDSVMGEFYTYL